MSEIKVGQLVEFNMAMQTKLSSPGEDVIWHGRVKSFNPLGVIVEFYDPVLKRVDNRMFDFQQLKTPPPYMGDKKYFRYGEAFYMVVNKVTYLIVRRSSGKTSIEYDTYMVTNAQAPPGSVEISEEEFVNIYREALSEIEYNSGIYEIIQNVDDQRIRRETIADDDYHRVEQEQETDND
jgi:hypothetical protein